MRSLQLLSVLVTTCLPAAFAEIIDNTDAKKVITVRSRGGLSAPPQRCLLLSAPLLRNEKASQAQED
ncbi:BQ5605_C023g09620 [Microbotryum silenes-dioicae]|uniref:BQ5605_C023g09620 protein n=1 Tax=Microbotryum silenes-dioicae TaxID=796604 RepID=A0A2X0MPC5_9BASI|nr:BQ5605_C023g09620 [Microbotryum silenes-dioicae]